MNNVIALWILIVIIFIGVLLSMHIIIKVQKEYMHNQFVKWIEDIDVSADNNGEISLTYCIKYTK